jgi:hypothetical protein
LTNFFQDKNRGIIQPSEVRARKDGDRIILEWNTALAGSSPLVAYEIHAGDRLLQSIPFRPQMTEAPLTASVSASAVGSDPVSVVATDTPPTS